MKGGGVEKSRIGNQFPLVLGHCVAITDKAKERREREKRVSLKPAQNANPKS